MTDWCPEVFKDGLTLTVCGADTAAHDGPCRLGDVEWWPDRGRKVRRTVDGDVVGAPARRPVPPPQAPQTHLAIVGAFDGRGQARDTDPYTSHQAAAQFPLRKGSARSLLLLAFADAGDRGATDERAAYVAGLSPRSEYATRCSELKRAGLVYDTDETRPGTAGAQRVVRRITPAGAAAADGLA